MDAKPQRPSGDDHWTKKKPGSIARGEKIHTAKLSPGQIEAIKVEHASGRTTQKALAEKYGITQPQISRIVNNKRWTHVVGTTTQNPAVAGDPAVGVADAARPAQDTQDRGVDQGVGQTPSAQ